MVNWVASPHCDVIFHPLPASPSPPPTLRSAPPPSLSLGSRSGTASPELARRGAVPDLGDAAGGAEVAGAAVGAAEGAGGGEGPAAVVLHAPDPAAAAGAAVLVGEDLHDLAGLGLGEDLALALVAVADVEDGRAVHRVVRVAPPQLHVPHLPLPLELLQQALHRQPRVQRVEPVRRAPLVRYRDRDPRRRQVVPVAAVVAEAAPAEESREEAGDGPQEDCDERRRVQQCLEARRCCGMHLS